MNENAYDIALLVMQNLDKPHIWEAVYGAVVDHIQHTNNFNAITKEIAHD